MICVLPSDPPLAAEVNGALIFSGHLPLCFIPAGAEASASCSCAACVSAGLQGVQDAAFRGLLCRLTLPVPDAAASSKTGATIVMELGRTVSSSAPLTSLAALRAVLEPLPASVSVRSVLLSAALRAYCCTRAHAGTLFSALHVCAAAAGALVSELAPTAGSDAYTPWQVCELTSLAANDCDDACTYVPLCSGATVSGTGASAWLRARSAVSCEKGGGVVTALPPSPLAPAVISAVARYALYQADAGKGLRALSGWVGPAAVLDLWREESLEETEAATTDVTTAAAQNEASTELGADDSAIPYHVALLGGAFSPITAGHLAAAAGVLRTAGRESRSAPQLEAQPPRSVSPPPIDELWLCPSGARPDKPSLRVAPWPRFAMAMLALEAEFGGDSRARVAPLELWRQEVAPTRQLLRRLAMRHPHVRFSIVIGADLLPALPTWIDAPALMRECSFFIIGRPGYELPAATGSAWPRRAFSLAVPGLYEASSTEARALLARAADGDDAAWPLLRALVPAAALAYALEHGLYQTGASTEGLRGNQ